MGTIGEILGDARQDSGLSIEDVAHETHIHPGTIRSIEKDDLSTFASVAYAKSFIRKYAEFLEVDISGALEALNSGMTVRLGDNELMDEMKRTIKKDRRFRLERRPKAVRRNLDRPGSTPILLNLILIGLVAALASFYFLGFNTNNAEEAKEEIAKGLQKAIPFSEKTGAEASHTAAAKSQPPSPEKVSPPSQPAASTTSPPHRPRLQAVNLTEPAAPSVALSQTSSNPTQVENGTTYFGPAGQTESVANTSAKPKLFDQGPEIEKPEVKWKVEKPRPRPLAKASSVGPESEAPSVRATPEVTIESEAPDAAIPSIRSEELPALKRALEEPTAALRPEGTNPRTPEEEAADKTPESGEQAISESAEEEPGNVARAE